MFCLGVEHVGVFFVYVCVNDLNSVSAVWTSTSAGSHVLYGTLLDGIMKM